MNHSIFRSVEELYQWVLQFTNVEKGQATEFKLDRMRWMAEALGNPHFGRLTAHVAGSKGKGSVSTMIARVLASAGLPTGLYTSPHILSWKERISLAGNDMPDDILCAAGDEVYQLACGLTADACPGGELPTYFELTTLIAFCAFRAARLKAQVVEVGLGGRLDSTNIVAPDVCVITPIELEHTQYLGTTIPQIAGEKAGIIKPGVPVCALQRDPDALEVIRRRAEELGSPCHVVGPLGKSIEIRDISVDRSGTRCTLIPTKASPPRLARLLGTEGLRVQVPLIGAMYAENMAVAALALSLMPVEISGTMLVEGFSSAQMLARFQVLSTEPFIVMDGAHTPSSMEHTLNTFLALAAGPRLLLFGCAKDKHHKEMANLLACHFDVIVITKPGTFKQSDPASVRESFLPHAPDVPLIEDTAVACETALRQTRELKGSLLVPGSFYLCAEFLRVFQ
ncbi:MAG: bifunctional folylpolyglutamate synthase/dihydrofolate synthase, partial [Rectinema sp.]|nr:bifunctional folylpolyglutamate synthase/dihydrofolate synthase [Rectinema sp.]